MHLALRNKTPAHYVVIVLLLLYALPVYSQTPKITSFTPATICQGDSVTITGTNFLGTTDVILGDRPASGFKIKDDKTITARAHLSADSGKVIVIKNQSKDSSATPIAIKPAPIPDLTDVSPNVDIPFTNCDGNSTYELTVKNSSKQVAPSSVYDIDWGDGTAHFTQTGWTVGAQKSHTYTSQGYFKIVLTITPPNGCISKERYNFYNGANPLSSFTTTDPTTGLCTPAPVKFKIGNWFNNSAGTIYVLDYGDSTPFDTLAHPLNSTNTDRIVSHTYNKSSCPDPDYTATLRASNGCFTTTYTLDQIIVRERPKAGFETDSAIVCVGIPVCFNNLTEHGYSGTSCSTSSNFIWDFGDNTTSTDENPQCHTYASPGSYTVKLLASNTACGIDSVKQAVTVIARSAPPTVADNSIEYCQFETASQLSASGTGLLWYTSASGGTGSTTAPIPSTNTPGNTIYYVSQTEPNKCESPRTAITVTVYAKPSLPGVQTPVNLCKGDAASPLTATGTNLLWYTSATGGTGSTTAPVPSTATTGTTNYYVSQQANSCESDRTHIEVNVNDIPGIPGVTSPLTYCQHQPATPLTASGTGLLWYTVATGGTGSPVAPTPSTATPGTITYYVSQSNYCGESPRAAITVKVNAGPSASIKYNPSVFCNVNDNITNPPVPVVLTGTGGGSFSIQSSGLSINATTGMITPAGAAAGNYTVTYFLKGTNGCSDVSTTTTVSVVNTPSAIISYPLMCSSQPDVSVTLTGTQGGVFSSSTGLVIDKTTGAISPSQSIPGNYTVTYTIAPSPPCPGFDTTVSITITRAPSASITYSPSDLCNVKNDAINPPVNASLTGDKDGNFSAQPQGLAIDPATGKITPGGATAGVYTITYTIAASGGCPEYKTTATVTINSTPTAAISYPPICSSDPNVAVKLTGTQGGSFSSGTGLSLDKITGTISPSQSAPGTYTVTYIITPSPPCPGFTTTTTLTIDESPAITFPVSSQAVCSGQPAVFTPGSSVPNTVYSWAVVGTLPSTISGATSGTASGSNPSINLLFVNAGTVSETITIRVTPTNPTPSPCGGAAHDLSLTINPIPALLKGDTTRFCMHDPPAALTISPGAGNTVKWYDINNVLLNQAPVINTTVPAQFQYYATQTNVYGCESPKSLFTAIVNPVAKIIGSSYTNPTACGLPSGSITLQVVDLNNNQLPNIPVLVHYIKFQAAYTVNDSTDAFGNIVIPVTAGTYSDIYVETYGCSSQKIPDVFVLKDPNPPAQPIAGYNGPVCSETAMILSASSPGSSLPGPVDYVWVGPAFGNRPDTTQNTVVNFPSANTGYNGIYIVYAMQQNCISAATSFSVEVKQSPAKPGITATTPLCIGDRLSLQAVSSVPGNSVLNYVWNGPGTGFPVNAPNAGISNVRVEDGGIYTVSVTAPQTGCTVSEDTLIQIGGYPIVRFTQDTLQFPTGHMFSLTPQVVNATDPNILPMQQFLWTPADNIACNDAICASPVVTVKNNVCYTVKASNIYGCSGSDTICINTYCKNAQVFIPNAFTPRGLAVNSRFMVRASGIASIRSFRVFNRWGKVVFERNNFSPNDPAYGWDGNVNGKPADMGVYVYTVQVICENGTPYFYKGNVTLLQ